MFKKMKLLIPLLAVTLLLFGSCLTVCAEDSLISCPVLPDSSEFSTDYPYYIVVYYAPSDTFYLKYSKSKFYVNNGEIYTNSDTVYSYTCKSTKPSWIGGLSTCDGLIMGSSFYIDSQFVASNYDVCDNAGNVVFQVPRPIAALAEELPGAVQTQVMVILPIAAFCLASLVGLVMLRRKLPAFLSR